MKTYTIYQIVLTDAQVNEVNRSGGVTPDFYARYSRTTFNPTEAVIVAARDLYNKVGKITADSLEGVFKIGNIGPEECIERLAPMKSLSVGDVVVDQDGNASVVASFGFADCNAFEVN